MEGKKLSPRFVDVVFQQRQKFSQCPVAVFLALAFADDAFQDVSTPQELFTLKIPSGKERLTLRYKPSARCRSIFRQFTTSGKERGGKTYTTPLLHKALTDLSIRAGYETSIKPHYIRWGVANKVDENATAAQRNHLLGHSHHGIDQAHYVSDPSSVNAQGTVLDGMSTTGVAQFKRIQRDVNAPDKLPSEKYHAVMNLPDLQRLKQELAQSVDENERRLILIGKSGSKLNLVERFVSNSKQLGSRRSKKSGSRD
ncbi:MAG: hypothetical protein M1817_005987 [Caeruleum heppii]|nr:MAG: hypothetical protein M1817_005987 [Caeruleum heppii]